MLNKFKYVYQYLIKADVEQRPIRDVYDFVTDSEIMFAYAIEACISNISSLQKPACGGLFIGQLAHTFLSAAGRFYLTITNPHQAHNCSC